MSETTGGQTSAGGREFPATNWSVVRQAQASATDARREALDRLCRRYWKPVYHFTRGAWKKSREDAKDLTQAFFAWLAAGDAIRRYSQERGAFRPFLKSLLRHFSADQQDAAMALKRGGAVRLVPLDAGETPLDDMLADAGAPSPDDAFDTAWKRQVLDRAIASTRAHFEAAGRGIAIKAFDAYDLSEGEPTYAAVAAQIGVKEGDVRNYLFEVREHLRSALRAEIAETASSPQELEDEWNALFGA